jgi:D-alanyl-lipoteichoic acid acyltransferase DltB (MBOAT superfamily)
MAFIPAYIFVLSVLIVIDYFMAIWVEESLDSKKKHFLLISILATCSVLFFFKYFNFINANCQAIAHFVGWNYPIAALRIILPIGLSFHTFQSLAYVIEVYKGEQKAERNFWVYSLYVMFYPQLVAGPIERPGNLLHQFYETHYYDYRRETDGLKLMAWGMFKKIVIADQLALCVNKVYGDPSDFNGPAFVLATVFFAFQIYCDFSGYSDIAIGAAQVMGFKLMDNFNRPYSSRSISEFWKRWHISLSSWFRDYVYIPLGGNRVNKNKWMRNIFITFLLSGFWHGANWTYLIWGGLNAFYLLFSNWTIDLRDSIRKRIGFLKHKTTLKDWQILITFSLICFSWIFFRAQNLNEAFYIINRIPYGWGNLGFDNQKFYDTFGLYRKSFLFSAGLICILIIVHTLQNHGSIRHMLNNRPTWVRWSLYYLIVLGIILGGVQGRNAFIYFQF